jgi:hypothetical protein
MPLDILSGILTQASNQSPEEWGIIRVAITSLQRDTYIARVYFGVALPFPFISPPLVQYLNTSCGNTVLLALYRQQKNWRGGMGTRHSPF